MAAVTTDAHGVRVVTELIPLMKPEPPCSSAPSEAKYSKAKPIVPYITRVFLKGEPIALGTVQVFIGLVMIALGTITMVTATLQGEVPLALGILYVICGSVTMVTYKRTCVQLIKSTLAMNLIGALLALTGICYFCFKLAIRPGPSECADSRAIYDYKWQCYSMTRRFNDLMDGLKSVMLVFCVLEVCMCTTLVVFSCKASRSSHSEETTGGDSAEC